MSFLSWVLPVVVAILVGGSIHSYLLKGQKLLLAQQEARQREEEERRRTQEAIEREARAQEAYDKRMKALHSRLLQEHSALFQHLRAAAENLDEAKRFFEAQAYRPFWQGIKCVVGDLGRYQTSLRTLVAYKRRFLSELESTYWHDQCPVYPKQVDQLPEPESVSKRLEELLWRGQTDRGFAGILEQIRTQEILVNGFTELSEAIFQLGGEIREGFRQAANESTTLGLELNQQTEIVSEIRDTLKQLEDDGKKR